MNIIGMGYSDEDIKELANFLVERIQMIDRRNFIKSSLLFSPFFISY